MTDLILSRRDIDFLLYEWLDAESLSDMPRYRDHSRETFDAVLDLSVNILPRTTKKMMPTSHGLMAKRYT